MVGKFQTRSLGMARFTKRQVPPVVWKWLWWWMTKNFKIIDWNGDWFQNNWWWITMNDFGGEWLRVCYGKLIEKVMYSEFSYSKWWFSMVTLVYQRVFDWWFGTCILFFHSVSMLGMSPSQVTFTPMFPSFFSTTNQQYLANIYEHMMEYDGIWWVFSGLKD